MSTEVTVNQLVESLTQVLQHQQCRMGSEAFFVELPADLAKQAQLALTQQAEGLSSCQTENVMLRAKVAKLDAELNKVYARLASEVLRANQMTSQHRMQAAMHTEARGTLAKVKIQLVKLREAAQNWVNAPKDDALESTATRIALSGALTREIASTEAAERL